MRGGRAAIAVTVALALALPARPRAQTLGKDTASRHPPTDTAARRAALDSLTILWSNDAFSSVVDGQPIAPGQGELVLDIGWLNLPTPPKPLLFGIGASYTPRWSPFFWDSQFGLVIPLRWGSSGLRLNRIGLAWQQRWVASIRHKLTFATYLQTDFPTSDELPGILVTLVCVAARAWESGTGFLNGILVLDGEGGPAAWGVLTAYKSPLSRNAYLSIDYSFLGVRAQRSVNIIEGAVVFVVGPSLAVSPGAVLGLGHRETTPLWGAGVRFTFTF